MIAVTGGLGTGKSTVCKTLAFALNAELIDTDEICREQLEPGAEGHQKVRDLFGPHFFQTNGRVDRDLLRQKVFDEPKAKEDLEQILHPLVACELLKYRKDCTVRNSFFVVEVPLLFEVGWQNNFDSTMVVYVPNPLCVERVISRDNLPKQLIYKIISSQMQIEQKRDLADYCIDNSGTFASTQLQVHYFSRLLKVRKNNKQ